MKKIFALIVILGYGVTAMAQHQVKKPEIGIVQELQQDSLLAAAGYTLLVESVAKWFSPLKFSDEQFTDNLKTFRTLKLKLFAVNIFMPGDMKLVGPDVKEEVILPYVTTVFERCQRAGISLVIWGSGGARRVPDGFDHAKATEQFIDIARKVAVLAKRHNIQLALENLNNTETNFINTVADALAVVKKVDHPNFMLCVDIYHMLKQGEGHAIIAKTKKYLVHCEVAEKDGRTPPGVHGDDFRPYLVELRKIQYSTRIILECRWDDLTSQALPARLALQKQIDEAYADKGR